MPLFPTQYSTLSAPALGKYIEARYGLTGLHCRYLTRGVSDTYLAQNESGKYIFKVYRRAHRSPEEIAGEVELLTHLRSGGASVAAAIPDRDGQALQAIDAAEGPRTGVLFSFAPGGNVIDLSDRQLRNVAHGMAAIHNITSRVELAHPRMTYDLHSTLIRPLETLKPAFAEYQYPEGHDYLNKTAEKVIHQMERFRTETFGYGYCHYDFLPKNFHFDDHDTPTFFDFDFAGKGYLVNDLMTLFMHYFLLVRDFGWTPEKARERLEFFVAAYREVRPVSDEELAAIPCLGFAFWTFYLSFQYENFDDWSNFFFGTRYLKSRIDLVKHWSDLYCGF